MNDLRTQLPECPLEYEVPHIPGTHTALVIPINAADIDWQEKMLPWTLASLINNTDLIMKGVHLYIACEDGTEDRIQNAISNFSFPPDPPVIIKRDTTQPFITFGGYGLAYDSVCMFDVNYWAFRCDANTIKLPLGHALRHNWGWGLADYNLHIANDILQKDDAWVRMSEPLRLTSPNSPRERMKLANHLMEGGKRARWLHDANTAVYGENYQKKGKNVAAYFFNETEPNWHLDASILQYQASDVAFIPAADWFTEWQHLGTDALIALHLLKNGEHAYNLRDSLMIEDESYTISKYPKLFNMRYAPKPAFRDAMKHLMGAQLAMKV